VFIESAAWERIGYAMKHLVEEIGRTASAPTIPMCSPDRAKRLTDQWRTVSEFLSTYALRDA
jgi:hypothetical protein